MDFTLNRAFSAFSFRAMNFLLNTRTRMTYLLKCDRLERIKLEYRFSSNLTEMETARVIYVFPPVTCRFFVLIKGLEKIVSPLANHCSDSPFGCAPFRFRYMPLESFHPSLILCRNPLSLVSYIRLR